MRLRLAAFFHYLYPLKMADGAVVLFYGLLNTQNPSPVLDLDAAGDRVWFSSVAEGCCWALLKYFAPTHSTASPSKVGKGSAIWAVFGYPRK